MAPERRTAVVEEIRPLNPRVREIELRLEKAPFPYESGQWVAVYLPVGPQPPKVRAYSLATPATGDGRITLSFNRGNRPDSATDYLFDLEPGDKLEISGPNGGFTLPPEREHDFLFVARFTGIVPIRCMILDLFSRPFTRDVVLIYGAQSPEDLVYGEEFEALAGKYPNFRYFPCVQIPSAGWKGEVGSEAACLERTIRSPEGRLAYLCGLRALVTPAEEALQRIGFPAEQIRRERYD